ncbi:hypothetical protein BDW72DRAFT_198168 [Aspergillus terricola var. indicus]
MIFGVTTRRGTRVDCPEIPEPEAPETNPPATPHQTNPLQEENHPDNLKPGTTLPALADDIHEPVDLYSDSDCNNATDLATLEDLDEGIVEGMAEPDAENKEHPDLGNKPPLEKMIAQAYENNELVPSIIKAKGDGLYRLPRNILDAGFRLSMADIEVRGGNQIWVYRRLFIPENYPLQHQIMRDHHVS